VKIKNIYANLCFCLIKITIETKQNKKRGDGKECATPTLE